MGWWEVKLDKSKSIWGDSVSDIMDDCIYEASKLEEAYTIGDLKKAFESAFEEEYDTPIEIIADKFLTKIEEEFDEVDSKAIFTVELIKAGIDFSCSGKDDQVKLSDV